MLIKAKVQVTSSSFWNVSSIKLTNCMKHGISLEANISSACQEITLTLQKSASNYHSHKSPALSLSWTTSFKSTCFHSILKIYFNIIPPTTPVCFKCSFSLRFSHQNHRMPLFCFLYVLHAPPILFFLTWSPENYLMRNSDHIATRCAVLCTLLLQAQTSSSDP